MSFHELLAGGGILAMLIVLALLLLVFLAPIGIWFALHRQAKAQEALARAIRYARHAPPAEPEERPAPDDKTATPWWPVLVIVGLLVLVVLFAALGQPQESSTWRELSPQPSP